MTTGHSRNFELENKKKYNFTSFTDSLVSDLYSLVGGAVDIKLYTQYFLYELMLPFGR